MRSIVSSTNKILVTGVTSGLGKYIYENVPDCVGLTRGNRHYVLKDEYDLIIHCAFSSERGNDVSDNFDFIDSNILLTNELVNTKHTKFIYISSLAVYDEGYSNYKSTKLYSESIVEKKSDNFLIVRVPAMLGVDIRPNSIWKILNEKKPQLTLHQDSTFNYVLHSDVLDYILSGVSGISDFISDENITLGKVNEILDGSCIFGDYKFVTPELDGVKWKTTEKVIEEFKEL
tara:strand:+ start:766 stop:1458 length:693 start_codon:yes stop_codon:yes gene_type:complete